VFKTKAEAAPAVQWRRPVTDDRLIERFLTMVSSMSLATVMSDNDPCRAMSKFISLLYSAYNSIFPLRRVTINCKRRPPWLTPDLNSLIKKKYRLLRELRRNKITRQSFNAYRNILNYVVKLSKRLYYRKKIYEQRHSSKKTWQVINELLKRKVTNTNVSLAVDGETLSDCNMTNHFNTYFTSIAAKLVSELPRTNIVRNMSAPGVLDSCFLFPTDVLEVNNILTSFANKKYNKDEIQPAILCKIHHVICPVLTHIINNCMTLGIYPNVLKHARVVPIFKSGDPTSAANYRPISTLSVFNKVFEKILHSRLVNFFTLNNVLTDSQYGFRKKRNTTLAIFSLVQDLLKSFNKKKYTICLFLDLRKAFDTVDRVILLDKLSHYGIRGNANALVNSYLTNRDQFVTYRNSKSNILPCTVGVPQGSVLGPLLFNIYINDLASVCNAKSILFADDAVLYVERDEFDDAVSEARRMITALSLWLAGSKLTAHEDKTKLMLYTSRPHPELPIVYFNQKRLEWVKNIKYLGVILDEKLTFSPQILSVRKKLSKVQGIIYAVSKLLTRDALVTLYHSLAYSQLIQSIIIWGGATNQQIQPVKVILNNILRNILGVKYDLNHVPLMHVDEMYDTLRLLQFDEVYKYFLLKFIRDAKFLNTEIYQRYFVPLIPSAIHYTRNQRFNVPSVRLEIEKRSTVYRSVTVFNSVPSKLTEVMCSQTFKKLFMNFIFDDPIL
jgi:hypothetical protein